MSQKLARSRRECRTAKGAELLAKPAGADSTSETTASKTAAIGSAAKTTTRSALCGADRARRVSRVVAQNVSFFLHALRRENEEAGARILRVNLARGAVETQRLGIGTPGNGDDRTR